MAWLEIFTLTWGNSSERLEIIVSIRPFTADVAWIIALWDITQCRLISLLRYNMLPPSLEWPNVVQVLLNYTPETSTWTKFINPNMMATLSSEAWALTCYRAWRDILAGRHLDYTSLSATFRRVFYILRVIHVFHSSVNDSVWCQYLTTSLDEAALLSLSVL